jgi:hypothetical protein
VNHNPGLTRDPYGHVSGNSVQAFFDSGNNTPASWRMRWVTWHPQPATVPFNRYVTNLHWVTTGFVPSGYRLEETLGYLLTGSPAGVFPYQSNGGGVRALYGCQLSSQPLWSYQFVSTDPNCEGQATFGAQGWIYSSPPSGISTRALYRCRDGADHFVSTDPGCEAQVTEELLGYAKTSP